MTTLDAWLTLTAAPGVGPRTCARLIAHFGSPDAVVAARAGALAELGLRPDAVTAIKQPNRDWIGSVLAWAAQPDAYILARDDPRYPPLLAEIPDPPILLYVRGDPRLLAEPQVAIVGSRNPTPTGREMTRDFASRLAACGLVITSGLATGIDGAAHAGALKSGKTIAVLGTGPDRVYPAGHRDLARQIVEEGALVSEFAPGEGPRASNFPRRNRIISGLSLGILVTEAALRSGSLITARQAGEQGREVFAVPGSIRNPLARGCHALIRDGAHLVEDPAEVLAQLSPLLRRAMADGVVDAVTDSVCVGGSAAGKDLDPDYQRLLAALGFDPVAPDALIRATGLPAEAVSSMLLVLELEGHVSSEVGGCYCRVRE